MHIATRRYVLRSLCAATFAFGLPLLAGDRHHGCVSCGCRDGRCRKVCRLVREEKKITTVCWGMECEDFCVPGPSTPDCKQDAFVSPKMAEDKEICARPKRIVWTSWLPGCSGDIYTKRKLMKKTVTKSVPSFKWVVEDRCPECIAMCEPVDVPEGSQIPPAPKTAGLLHLGVDPAAVAYQSGLSDLETSEKNAELNLVQNLPKQ